MKKSWLPEPETLRDLLYIWVFAASLRLLLLWLFPVPYGHDGFGRLFFRDRIFLGHWLPLTQVLVWAGFRLLDSAVLVRLFFALLTAGCGWGFYLLLRLVTNRRASLTGGLIFSCNSLLLFLSLMPYQDVLFLGLFLASLAFLMRDDGLESGAGWFLFGLASLTRYESWFLAPVLLALKLRADAAARQRKGIFLRLAMGLLAVGWGPLLWLSLNKFFLGSYTAFLFRTADARLYAWNPHMDPAWLVQYAGQMFYWVGLFGSPLVFLAPAGLWQLLQCGQDRHRVVGILATFGVLVAAFYFLIMGKGQDTVFRFSLIPLILSLFLATLATDPLLATAARLGIGRRPVLALLLPFLCLYGSLPVVRVTQSSEYRDSHRIALELGSRLGPGEAVLVVAPRLDPREAAPLPYQRIAVELGPERVFSSALVDNDDARELLHWARLQRIRYLVRIYESAPQTPADRLFCDLAQPRTGFVELVYQTPLVSILEVRNWPPVSALAPVKP